MKFNEYVENRVAAGDTWAKRFLKTGKVPLRLVLDEARARGYSPDLIARAEQKGMLQGDLEMTYEGAQKIYEDLKALVKQRTAAGKGQWVDVLDQLDPVTDHEVIANVLFALDPEIRKKVGSVDSIYRVILNVGAGRKRGYHLSLKQRKGYETRLLTPELETIVSSIPEATFDAASEEARRLRAILNRKAEAEVFPLFRKNPREAFELLEDKIQKNGNANLQQTYRAIRDRYREYESFHVDGANSGFTDPETHQPVELPSLHQRIGIYHLQKEKRFGIFDGCGTGKTAIGVLAQPLLADIVRSKGTSKGFLRTVIVCPNNTKKAWKDGLIGKDTVRYLAKPQEVLVINGETKDQALLAQVDKAQWILLNKEQLQTRVVETGELFVQHLARLGIDYLIIDEAHNFKSQRDVTAGGRLTESGAVRLLARDVPYLCLLTGTPIPDTLKDYGVLYHLLNPQACPDPKKFDELYENNPRILYTLFSEKSIRRKSQDINDELSWEDEELEIPLTPTQRAIYDHIIEFRPSSWLVQARKALLDPRLVDPEILQRAGYLGKVRSTDSSKYAKLEELLADKAGPLKKKEKFVIFSSMFRKGVTHQGNEALKRRYMELGLDEHYASLEMEKSLPELLQEGLKKRGYAIKLGVIDGTREVLEREQTVERLGTDLDGLLVTTDTGGESLSMVAANWAYTLDDDYAPKTEEQKRARLLRKGQAKPVHFVALRGEDTLDMPLRDYVRKKVVLNTIAVDGLPLTEDEWELLQDTEGKKFGDMIRRGLGGKSINVLEAVVEQASDFGVVRRTKGQERTILQRNINYNTTEAQEIMRWIGKDPINCWHDPAFVELYMKTLPNLAVPVIHRAKICDLLRRADAKEVVFPHTIISEGSGPSLLYDSYHALHAVVEQAGFRLPQITDRDFSQLMLNKGNNPLKVHGDMTGKGSTIADASFDMVDNESISLLRNETEVQATLREASRILKPNGLIELIVKNMRFIPDFYIGMEKLGFELLSEKNEGFRIGNTLRERLKQTHGEHFADAYAAKLNGTHLLIARKIDNPQETVVDKHFWFEPLTAEHPLIGTTQSSSEIATHKKELFAVSIESTAKEIEKASKGRRGSTRKKVKQAVRILPESIPGLKAHGKTVKGEY